LFQWMIVNFLKLNENKSDRKIRQIIE
jgi:hypothetical protein